MVNETIRITFPNLDDATAHEQAQRLLSELKQTHELRPDLDLDQSTIARSDKDAMDLGATLIVVLSAPAVIILAKTIKSWVERTGNTSSIALNGIRIDNVASHDVADIVQALHQPTSFDRK